MARIWPLKENRWALMLTILLSAFFLASVTLSAITYSNVTLAQQRMTLENPVRTVTVLDNGTVVVGFSISVNNPGKYIVHVTTLSWYTQVDNVSGAPPVIPLGSTLATESQGLIIPAKGVKDLSFEVYVTGQKLAQLKGFVNYSNSLGGDLDLLTIQYVHSFEIRGWLDDFGHDYLREDYLNQLVQIELRYVYPGAAE